MKPSIKKIIILSAFAGIAAIGTLPYGFKFSYLFFPADSFMQLALGCFFATTASLANMALGLYSLLNIKTYKNFKQLPFITCLCLLATIPNGFICYFGYKNILPNYINLTMSFIVMVVNAGIGFTAIKNLLKELSLPVAEISHQVIGVLVGGLVSVIAYLAATNGVMELLHYFQWDNVPFAYGIALLPWIPTAALFANANQSAIKKISSGKFMSQNLSLKYSVILLIFSLASGSAFAQMCLDFYSPALLTPSLFKLPAVQALVFPVFMPLTFFSSFAVNYFSLQNLIKLLTHK